MEFKRFAEFLKERDVSEAVHANREAMAFDTGMQIFRNRFSDIKHGEKMVKAAGYSNIREFIRAAQHDPSVWSQLQEPGQDNYVRPQHKKHHGLGHEKNHFGG